MQWKLDGSGSVRPVWCVNCYGVTTSVKELLKKRGSTDYTSTGYKRCLKTCNLWCELQCRVSGPVYSSVWLRMSRWLWLLHSEPGEMTAHWPDWRGKEENIVLNFTWHANIWSIIHIRNNDYCSFNEKSQTSRLPPFIFVWTQIKHWPKLSFWLCIQCQI